MFSLDTFAPTKWYDQLVKSHVRLFDFLQFSNGPYLSPNHSFSMYR